MMKISVLLVVLSVFSSVLCLDYTNPIVGNTNVPDPGVIVFEGKYYVATTSGNAASIFPIRSSSDLVHWTVETSIFKMNVNKPKWAVSDFWAPEIHKVGDTFVAYFAARDTTGMLCVGAASAHHILGPYQDIGHPLVRNSSVGNIDPTYHFEEKEKQGYLIWKEDGNGRNPPEKYTPIWAIKVTANGLKTIGEKVEILKNDPASWEGPLVEAPWVIVHNGTYYLFYSANGYAGNLYAVGVAKSHRLLGPYEKYNKNPIVHSATGHWSGPGHCSVVRDPKTSNFFMVYHSWLWDQFNGNRVMVMDKIVWDGVWPIIENNVPSWTSQPTP